MKAILRSGFLALAIIAAWPGFAAAETVTVKYRGSVPLDKFDCPPIKPSSFVNRICYDDENVYLIVLLRVTYYHYCEIDAATVEAWRAAPSLGRYYNANIKGWGSDGPFDCRTHRVPRY